MKKVMLTLLLIIFIGSTTFARKLVAEGKSFTSLGNFKIETADQPFTIGGVSLDTYIITYDNTKMPVTIVVQKDRKCRRFITISDRLSVQYVCYGNRFGVEKLDQKYISDGIKTSESALNRFEYFHQKVLTRDKNDVITCMKLIGSYFPALLNDTDIITASR